MNRCIVTGVSGRHRINRPRCTGALCSAWEEKFQCVRINRRHRVGLSDRLSRIIRRVQWTRRSKSRVILQRGCFLGWESRCGTGWSDVVVWASEQWTGAMIRDVAAQKKKSPSEPDEPKHCRSNGLDYPWWRSSLVEPGIKLTVDSVSSKNLIAEKQYSLWVLQQHGCRCAFVANRTTG